MLGKDLDEEGVRQWLLAGLLRSGTEEDDAPLIIDYIVILLGRNEDSRSLRQSCMAELAEFLGGSTKSFVNKLFDAIDDGDLSNTRHSRGGGGGDRDDDSSRKRPRREEESSAAASSSSNRDRGDSRDRDRGRDWDRDRDRDRDSRKPPAGNQQHAAVPIPPMLPMPHMLPPEALMFGMPPMFGMNMGPYGAALGFPPMGMMPPMGFPPGMAFPGIAPPGPLLPENERCTVRCTNVPDKFTEKDLFAHFKGFGRIVSIKAMPAEKDETGRLVKECLVQYTQANMAQRCIASPAAVLNNRFIKVLLSDVNIQAVENKPSDSDQVEAYSGGADNATDGLSSASEAPRTQGDTSEAASASADSASSSSSSAGQAVPAAAAGAAADGAAAQAPSTASAAAAIQAEKEAAVRQKFEETKALRDENDKKVREKEATISVCFIACRSSKKASALTPHLFFPLTSSHTETNRDVPELHRQARCQGGQRALGTDAQSQRGL